MKHWEGYVIRKILTNRDNKSYIYIKGGYVKDDFKHTFFFPDECYTAERYAKAALTKLKNQDIGSCLKVFTSNCSYEIVKVIDGHII